MTRIISIDVIDCFLSVTSGYVIYIGAEFLSMDNCIATDIKLDYNLALL